ncbi:MAG TPA: hypothetical protein PLD14_00935 [Candidatus Pacearchaeota archaeon]|nr:hypothetical protein [Candidatus Pacearchaeota archaeon]HPR79764.1 hypothetical protein [Candidatus Pacearchaeota archaeon]
MEELKMKTIYAFILIVICIAITIVGWNGLMKTYSAQSSSDNGNRDISTADGMNYYLNRISEFDDHSEKKNPFVAPIGSTAIGIVGACYGAYSIAKNMHPKLPKDSKPMGG